MEKEKIKRNTIVVGVSIQPKHVEYIKHLMEEKAFLSASDVHRRALEYFHDAILPDYVYKLTPAGVAKKKEQEKAKMLSEATPEDFAKNMSMPIRVATAGENLVKPGDKVAFTYFAAWTTPVPILLSRLQAFYKEYPGDLEEHLGRVKIEGPIEPLLTEGTRYVSNFGYTCTI